MVCSLQSLNFILTHRNAAKLKEVKEKIDNASKGGFDCKELKAQSDLLEAEKKKISDQDEELKQREKVSHYFET